MTSLQQVIKQGIALKNATIVIEEDEETGTSLNVEDLRKGARFSVRISPDEDRGVSVILTYEVKDDLKVEFLHGPTLSKEKVDLMEDPTSWLEKLHIPNLIPQIETVVTKALKVKVSG